VIKHEADLDSDFCRFHPQIDVAQVSFSRYYNLATRIWMHGGVMNYVARSEAAQREPQPQQQPQGQGPSRYLALVPRVGTPGAKGRPLSAAAMQTGGGVHLIPAAADTA
jgi:hypothetical protein